MDKLDQCRALNSTIETLAHLHRLSVGATDADGWESVIVMLRLVVPIVGKQLDEMLGAIDGPRTGYFDAEVRHA